jgi:hypothetical protein
MAMANGVLHLFGVSWHLRNSLIAVFKENRFATIAALRHVVRRTGYHHAGQTRHGDALEHFTSTLHSQAPRSAAFLPPQQASLLGTPVLEEKPRLEWLLCIHQK